MARKNIFDLAGKTAIVTGAALGLGRVIAQGLAEAGAKVVIADIKQAEGEDSAAAIRAAGGEAMSIPTDVTSGGQVAELVRQTVAHYGRLDIMVCNAGIDLVTEPTIALAESDWGQVIDVDLKGCFLCAREAARQMLGQGQGGSIIMISSIASVVATEVTVAYAAAKGGVNQLVRTMAMEWATQGIRVNAIAPGFMENIMEGWRTAYEDPRRAVRVQAFVNTFVPMQRKGRADELIGPAVFLASDASSYVTGSIYMVDGGYSAI